MPEKRRRGRPPRVVRRIRGEIRRLGVHVRKLLELPCLADCNLCSSVDSLKLLLPENQRFALKLTLEFGLQNIDKLSVLVHKRSRVRALQQEIQNAVSNHIRTNSKVMQGRSPSRRFAFKWRKFWKNNCMRVYIASSDLWIDLADGRKRLDEDYGVTNESILRFSKRRVTQRGAISGDTNPQRSGSWTRGPRTRAVFKPAANAP